MIKNFDKFLEKISLVGVIICVAGMLFLGVFNIILRQFDITFLWLEPMVRHLVFLGTFFGGSIAVGKNQHIKIDLISRLLEKSDKHLLKKTIRLITLIGTTVAVVILIFSSYQLVQLEFQADSHGFLGIHPGFMISIITVGMFLIFLRLLAQISNEIFTQVGE